MSNPAGWYPDPAGQPQQRFWDGGDWTDRTQPFPAPTAAKGGKKKRGTGLMAGGLMLAAIGVIITLVAASTTHVNGYGASATGPTVFDFLLIIAGLVLAAIGFCMRLLAAAESR